MKLEKIFESWRKYRLKRELKNLDRYFTPNTNNPYKNEGMLVKDTARGRERRLPLNLADFTKENLKNAFRGARMAGLPFSSSSSREEIRNAASAYMKAQDQAWSQLDVPDLRAARQREIKALLAIRRRPRP